MIIHLEKEQLKQARRDLLRDDVYIIFVDALRQYHQEGYTTLAPAELYLSAKYFVGDVLQLPDIIEVLLTRWMISWMRLIIRMRQCSS